MEAPSDGLLPDHEIGGKNVRKQNEHRFVAYTRDQIEISRIITRCFMSAVKIIFKHFTGKSKIFSGTFTSIIGSLKSPISTHMESWELSVSGTFPHTKTLPLPEISLYSGLPVAMRTREISKDTLNTYRGFDSPWAPAAKRSFLWNKTPFQIHVFLQSQSLSLLLLLV